MTAHMHTRMNSHGYLFVSVIYQCANPLKWGTESTLITKVDMEYWGQVLVNISKYLTYTGGCVSVAFLTHWGRVKHIYAPVIIIGSDNGFSPDRRQVIIQINSGTLLIWPSGMNFIEILIGNHIYIYISGVNTFENFENIVCKMSAICRPGGTVVCRYGNLQCRQRRQSWYYDDFQFSVLWASL